MARTPPDQVFSLRVEMAVKLGVLALFMLFPLIVGYAVWRESAYQKVGEPVAQPIPFSHKHHAADDGIDCRYCHTTVEKAASAGIPPSKTCMNCHSQIWSNSPYLEPVRASYRDDEPLRWTRVHDLPDYVYFNHSAHVTRGVGCESCHGRIDQMVKVWQAKPLTMAWCVDCHRNPTPNLREPANVTVMGYQPRDGGEGQRVKDRLKINPPTDCTTCHR